MTLPKFWNQLLEEEERIEGDATFHLNSGQLTWRELGERLHRVSDIRFLSGQGLQILPAESNSLTAADHRALIVRYDTETYLLTDEPELLATLSGMPQWEHYPLALTSPSLMQTLLAKVNATHSRTRTALPEIPDFLSQYLQHCSQNRVSDWHLEAQRDGYRNRIRIDGQLTILDHTPRELGQRLIQELKLSAGLKAEQCADAEEAKLSLASLQSELRIVLFPSLYGTEAVVRFLPQRDQIAGLDELGMDPILKLTLVQHFHKPGSLLIVNGPTGSGKSTTLHSLLTHHCRTEWKCFSIEDPVERLLRNVTQIEISKKKGIDFSNTVRALLRQSPDVIFIGEIRDSATARQVEEACLSGHRILTTLHAKNCQGALERLIDLGFHLEAVPLRQIGILAQKLSPIPCTACHGQKKINCQQCGGRGIYGRTGEFNFSRGDELKSITFQNEVNP